MHCIGGWKLCFYSTVFVAGGGQKCSQQNSIITISVDCGLFLHLRVNKFVLIAAAVVVEADFWDRHSFKLLFLQLCQCSRDSLVLKEHLIKVKQRKKNFSVKSKKVHDYNEKNMNGNTIFSILANELSSNNESCPVISILFSFIIVFFSLLSYFISIFDGCIFVQNVLIKYIIIL